MPLPEDQALTLEAAALERAVGARIRAQRQALGLTLEALGAGCGLSTAFLSRLERGRATTTIAGLLQIARALGIEPQALLAEAEPEARFGLYRSDAAPEARAIAGTDYGWLPVSAAWPGQRLSAFVLDFPAGGPEPTRVAHEGEELCVVLQGEVVFEVAGTLHRLRPGDAIHLDSALPHRARSAGAQPARMVMVTTGARGPARGLEWWSPPARSLEEEPQEEERP